MNIFPDNDTALDYIMETLNKACHENDTATAEAFLQECLQNPDNCLLYPASPLAVLVMTHRHPTFSQLESRKKLYLDLKAKWEPTYGKERTTKMLMGLNK